MSRKPPSPQAGSQEAVLRELRRQCNETIQEMQEALKERKQWLSQDIADYIRGEARRAFSAEVVAAMASLREQIETSKKMIRERFDQIVKFLMDSEEVDVELLAAAYALLKRSGSIQEVGVDNVPSVEDLAGPGVRHIDLPFNPNSPAPNRTDQRRSGRNRKGPRQ